MAIQLKDLQTNKSYSFDTRYPVELGNYKNIKLTSQEMNFDIAVHLDPNIANTLAALVQKDNALEQDITKHIFLSFETHDGTTLVISTEYIDLNTLTLSGNANTISVTVLGQLDVTDKVKIRNLLLEAGYKDIQLTIN